MRSESIPHAVRRDSVIPARKAPAATGTGPIAGAPGLPVDGQGDDAPHRSAARAVRRARRRPRLSSRPPSPASLPPLTLALLEEHRAFSHACPPSSHFQNACRQGDLPAVKALLKKHPELARAAYLMHRWTGLHIAAIRNHPGLVGILIAARADPEALSRWGETALDIAIRENRRGVIDRLLAAGARLRLSPLPAVQDAVGIDPTILPGEPAGAGESIDPATLSTDPPARPSAMPSAPASVTPSAPASTGSPASAPVLRSAPSPAPVVACLPALPRDPVSELRPPPDDLPPAPPRAPNRHLRNLVQLHKACARNDVKTVGIMLDEGYHINAATNTGVTPLIQACRAKAVEVALLLVARNADLSVIDDGGATALKIALDENLEPVARALIEKGAPVNLPEKTFVVSGMLTSPLHSAAAAGNVAMVNLLLERKAAVGARDHNDATPLHAAALHGRLEAAWHLIAAGAATRAIDKSGAIPLHVAVSNDHVALAGLLIDCDPKSVDALDYSNATPLYHAAERGSLGATKLLIARHAGIDLPTALEATPLFAACHQGDEDLVDALLTAGADPRHRNSWEATAAHFAASAGNTAALRLLHARAAKLDAYDINGTTPLCMAVMNSKHAAVVFLLELKAGVEIDARDCNGCTALYWAASRGDGKMVKLLIEAGASLEHRSSEGRSVYDAALARGDRETIEYLITLSLRRPVAVGRQPLAKAPRNRRI